jgi:hypothetical protein
MINLVTTLKQGVRICAKWRITFYKMRKSHDLYISPGADISELDEGEEEEHDSSHQVEGTDIEVVNNSLKATGESLVKKWM